MAAEIKGTLQGEIPEAGTNEQVTLEGDNITVTPTSSGGLSAAATKSPMHFIPILLVIAAIVAIWWYLKKKGSNG